MLRFFLFSTLTTLCINIQAMQSFTTELTAEHSINTSLLEKTPGDQLFDKPEPKTSISVFGVNLNTAYFVSKPGWKISTTDSPLPTRLTCSSLTKKQKDHISTQLNVSENVINRINKTIHSSMNLTIASEAVHRANKTLGAFAQRTFEKNTILSMRPGEAKCYSRTQSINPKVELLPFPDTFNVPESFLPDWDDRTTLWLSAGIVCRRKAEITILRDHNNELNVTFFVEYSGELHAETAFDGYCMDINEDGLRDGTAYGFLYTSLYAGLKPSYTDSSTFIINPVFESDFIDDFLNGSLTIDGTTHCAKSAFTVSDPNLTSPDAKHSARKHFTSKRSGGLSGHVGAEVSGGAGIASGHLAIKDKLETEGWFWPALDGNIGINFFKYSQHTDSQGISNKFDGPSEITLTGTLNLSIVVASNILGQDAKKGKDFWLLLYPFEVDCTTSYVIALKKKPDINNVCHLASGTPEETAFYSIELGVSKNDLTILDKSLSSAGVTNKDTRKMIRLAVCPDDSSSQSLILKYTTTTKGRDLNEISSGEYKLSEVLFYKEKKHLHHPLVYAQTSASNCLVFKKKTVEQSPINR